MSSNDSKMCCLNDVASQQQICNSEFQDGQFVGELCKAIALVLIITYINPISTVTGIYCTVHIAHFLTDRTRLLAGRSQFEALGCHDCVNRHWALGIIGHTSQTTSDHIHADHVQGLGRHLPRSQIMHKLQLWDENKVSSMKIKIHP